jgi:predicted NAD/FAD-dependent oxidoreductase
LTAKDPAFAEYVKEWREAGLIRKWFERHPTLKNESNSSGYPRYIGRKAIREIAKHLAKNIDIFQQGKVIQLRYASRWEIITKSTKSFFSSVVILTPPLPQSLELM